MKIIRKTVTHLAPHLDEYFASLLAIMFGRVQFHFLTGLTHVEVCVSDESVHHLSKNYPDWLCLGLGGGDFDDHGKQKEKSCCQLMAEYLDIQEDPRLVVLLGLVTAQDKKGARSPEELTLPRIINFMHRHGFTPKQMQEWAESGITQAQAIREWVERGLIGLIDSEALLLEKIKSEIGKMASPEAFQTELRARFFNRKRTWDTFNVEAIASTLGGEGPEWLEFGKEVVLRQRRIFQSAREVAIRSVEPLMTKFGIIRLMAIDGSEGAYLPFEVEFDGCSRTKSVNANLVLVRNSQNHTLIVANQEFKGNLAGFVRILRIAEAKKRGQEFPKEYYISEGSAPGEFSTWYVHEGTGYRRIYNGTTTRPIVDFSELSFEEIKELLLKWLDVTKFTAMPSLSEGPANLERAFEGTEFEKAADAG